MTSYPQTFPFDFFPVFVLISACWFSLICGKPFFSYIWWVSQGSRKRGKSTRNMSHTELPFGGVQDVVSLVRSVSSYGVGRVLFDFLSIKQRTTVFLKRWLVRRFVRVTAGSVLGEGTGWDPLVESIGQSEMIWFSGIWFCGHGILWK